MTDGDGVTRRDAMKGAAALGLGTAAAESASAQGSSEPRLQIGDNVELDENASGEPVLRHQPSGAELRYDSGAGSWTVGSFTTDNLVNAGEILRDAADGQHLYTIADYSDAGAAINQALADADADLGTNIHLPLGDYDIGETVTIPPSTASNEVFKAWYLIGKGGSGDKFPPMGTQFTSTITDGSDVFRVESNAHGGRVRDFSLTGSQSDGRGFYLTGTDWSDCQFLQVEDSGGSGFYIDTIETTFRYLQCRGSGDHGIHIDADRCRFEHCESERTTNRAIYIDRSEHVELYHPEGLTGSYGLFVDPNSANIDVTHGVFSDNDNWGVLWRAPRNISQYDRGGSIVGVRTLNNGSGGIQIDGEGTRVTGCKLEEDNGPHIQVTNNAKRCIFKDNVFLGTGVGYDLDATAVDIYVDDDTVNGALGASPSSGSLSLSFDTAFSVKPHLRVVTEGEAIWHVSNWGTDANGNYNSATLSFVDNAGSAANPTTHWKAIPRNLAL